MDKKPTVIYIISDRRSGSTLLENILSKSEQVVSVGELSNLNGHILKDGPGEKWNWTCACGQAVLNCPFWSNILKDLYTEDTSVDFETNVEWNYKSKKLAAIAASPLLFRKKLMSFLKKRKNRNVAPTVRNIYQAIFEKTGKSFIVDSSKDPIQALAVYNNSKDFNVKIIWLKRDVRALAVSKMKWKTVNEKKKKSLKKVMLDIFFYKRLCLAVSGLVSKDDLVKLNYEALATETQKSLDIITAKTGLQNYQAPEYMYIENDHTIGGTPNRFEKRPIALDESWKKTYKNKKFIYYLGGVLNKL